MLATNPPVLLGGVLRFPMILSLLSFLLVATQVGTQRPTEGALRLVGGRSPSEGNVEIFHLGRWGSVCDDEWDMREAQIVCRSLGFPRAIRATHDSEYGRGQRIIWMDNMFCTGEEPRLQACRFDGWGVHDCSIAEAAGVECEARPVIAPRVGSNGGGNGPFLPRANLFDGNNNEAQHIRKKLRLVVGKDVAVRLIGGRTRNEGRVEVRLGNDGWGVLCGDGWGVMEATVVCRQLGFGFAQSAVQISYFGGHRDNIVLAGVKCTGYERNLADCVHEQIGQVYCPGHEENIAGVVCAAALPDLAIDAHELERTSYLDQKSIGSLQCAMEENCVSSSAYRIARNQEGWQFEMRRLLRFTARIGNIGTADFRPFLAKQNWQWHQCHLHYHSMEVFAHFDIINQRGAKVAEGHKASFCLEDNECRPGAVKKYACANYGDQGITVGCVDTYHHDIDCQWVDITDLSPGNYLFKVSVNPEMKVAELSYDNNGATCYLYYSGIAARVYNCTLNRP